MSTFTVVARPPVNKRAFELAILATLESGEALAYPIGGEAYSVVRNRVSTKAAKVAMSVGARVRVRTQPSDDKKSVILWLEKKGEWA